MNSASQQKAIRKEIAQEEKDEDVHLRQVIKDINVATKEQQKAHKAVRKADSTVAKLGKKESVATAAVQKATHKHDIAATNLRSAQRDAELKRNEDLRLQRQLDEKKARLDTALQEQKVHKQGRESRLFELDSGRNGNRTASTGAAGVAGAAGHHRTHPTGPESESTTTGIRPNTGIRSADYTVSGATGNVPGQYDTGPQAPGTRAGGPGYAGHHTAETLAADAGLTGHGAQRDIAGQVYGDDRIRDGDGLGVEQIRTAGDQATYGPSGVAHRSDAGVGTGVYAGERSICRNDGYPTSGSYQQTNPEPDANGRPPAVRGTSGPFVARDTSHHPGDNAVREADTGYLCDGTGEFDGPDNILTATQSNRYGREQVISGPITGHPSATTGTGYSGAGGENPGFRGDPMLGGSGTGADPGIPSGGARDFGARGGSREFVGERNAGLGDVGEPRYGAERIGDQQYIHRGTGIGGRQGIDEDTEFSRDCMVVGGAERLGPGSKQTGDIGSGARGPLIGTQGLGEAKMPGGYTQETEYF